jgi:ferredoxin
MMDDERAVSENVPGPNYVVTSCIDCDTCRCIAPALFARSAAQGYSYVRKQVETAEEQELMEEAIECCPVNAIRGGGSTEEAPGG